MWWQAEGEGGVKGEKSKMGRRQGGLGGSRWRSWWFYVQNHFPGDTGHLTVGHCVGSVPATQSIISSTKTRQRTAPRQLFCGSELETLTFDFQIRSARQPGSVSQRKMTSTSGQNLASEVLRIKHIHKERILIQGDFTLSPCPFSYLDGVEWPLLCTQNCHKSCYWSWTRGALEQRYGTSAFNAKL